MLAMLRALSLLYRSRGLRSLLAGTGSRLAVAGGRNRLPLGVLQDGLLQDVGVDEGGRET